MATDLRFGDCPARLIFAEDIGPRLLRESELCEGQRMRILRRVAEGVAHHFGQILSVVEGQTTLVCEGRENPSEKEHLQQILAETRRGSALIRQLLAVGACEGIQPEPLDLNEFIRAKEGLLSRLLGERISLELRLVEGLQPALVDSRTVEHVILNLVLNSRDAMPHGGTVCVQTEATWVDHPQPSQEQSEQNAKPGPYVRLTVRDNGCGMSAEVQERIFEPFFTTREDDRAMGLGLATLYGVIKQHGGWIEFMSHSQHGTEFSRLSSPLRPRCLKSSLRGGRPCCWSRRMTGCVTWLATSCNGTATLSSKPMVPRPLCSSWRRKSKTSIYF
jgi:signal transduction histidine kinase